MQGHFSRQIDTFFIALLALSTKVGKTMVYSTSPEFELNKYHAFLYLYSFFKRNNPNAVLATQFHLV